MFAAWRTACVRPESIFLGQSAPRRYSAAVLRIDFYVQHLVRHNALGIELVSGKTVRFELEGGERNSSKPIEHAQIAQLVQEAAPAGTLEDLRATGFARFVHKSEAGMVVDIQVTALSPGMWTVRIEPAKAAIKVEPIVDRHGAFDSTPSIGQGSGGGVQPILAAPPAQSAPKTAPQAAPKPKAVTIQGVAGEPAINHYLRLMKAMDASDLHLSTGVPPMARVHGAMQDLEEGAPALKADELRKMLMEIAPETNREEFDECSDTDFAHSIEGLCRFRANIFEDRKGPGGVFRQIPFEILTVDQIGLPKKVLDLCFLSKGLVLVTGPTGSGKSTTLATLIDYINQNRSDHIITIEDPVEFVHPNKKCLINQREIGTHTKSFKAALRAALREDPDIVLVGEMRDLETIAIAIETAETGHLVFGTLHTTSAPSTVDRIIDQFPADQQEQIRVMLSESLRGVIAQVLCKKVGGGRVAAYEIMIANSAVGNLIREGKTYQLQSIMQTGKKHGMQTMNDDLLHHVKEGRVTAEEAYMKSNDKTTFTSALKQANIPLTLGKGM
jgi:twitching motility protein PilT